MAKTEMTPTQIKASRTRLKALERELIRCTPLMRGSVVTNGVRNKQPYFSLNKDRKTRLIYLGEKRESKAREMSANYARLLEIIDEMTLINMDLLKNDAAA